MAFKFHISKSHHTCRVKILGNRSCQVMPRIRGDHMRHSTLQTELTQSWLLVPMPVTESEVGKIKITETQNDDETMMLFLGFRAGSSFAQWHFLHSSGPAQPLQPSFLAAGVLCPVGHLSSTLVDENFSVSSVPSPTAMEPQPDELIYQHIKVLPAPAALPQ